jgi:hypothetical protein
MTGFFAHVAEYDAKRLVIRPQQGDQMRSGGNEFKPADR